MNLIFDISISLNGSGEIKWPLSLEVRLQGLWGSE